MVEQGRNAWQRKRDLSEPEPNFVMALIVSALSRVTFSVQDFIY